MLADYDIHVDVGDAENMDIKANWISHMIPELIEEGYRGGTLYVSGGRNASYSPEVKAPQETLPENLPSDSTIPEIEATPAPEGEE